jgi:hypothetical protein
LQREIRLGVLAGSLCAALAGVWWLKMGPRSHTRRSGPGELSG